MSPALQCLLHLIKISIPLLKDINDLKRVGIDYFVDGTANKYGRDITRSFGGHHNQIRLEAFIFLFDDVDHVLVILISCDKFKIVIDSIFLLDFCVLFDNMFVSLVNGFFVVNEGKEKGGNAE